MQAIKIWGHVLSDLLSSYAIANEIIKSTYSHCWVGKHCTQKFYIISIHYMTIFHSADFTFDWFPGMLIKKTYTGKMKTNMSHLGSNGVMHICC